MPPDLQILRERLQIFQDAHAGRNDGRDSEAEPEKIEDLLLSPGRPEVEFRVEPIESLLELFDQLIFGRLVSGGAGSRRSGDFAVGYSTIEAIGEGSGWYSTLPNNMIEQD